jgi:hypothetical protein
MEDETRVVVIVGGKKQVTLIITPRPQQSLAELTASSLTMLLKAILLFNAIIRAELGLFRYWQLACW